MSICSSYLGYLFFLIAFNCSGSLNFTILFYQSKHESSKHRSDLVLIYFCKKTTSCSFIFLFIDILSRWILISCVGCFTLSVGDGGGGGCNVHFYICRFSFENLIMDRNWSVQTWINWKKTSDITRRNMKLCLFYLN